MRTNPGDEFLETEASASNPAMGMISAPLNGILSAAIPAIITSRSWPTGSYPPLWLLGPQKSTQSADLLSPALTLGCRPHCPMCSWKGCLMHLKEAVSEAAAHVMTDGLTETTGNELTHFLVIA